MKTKLIATTPLERHVARWIKAKAANSYGGNIANVLKDLFYGGCQSGMVGHLIYYSDTTKFYKKYRDEIDEIISSYIEDGCLRSPADLRNWDKSDPFARGINNINILAWVGFEETARKLADNAGIEI